MNETLEAMARALFKSWFEERVPTCRQETALDLAALGVLQVGDGYRAKNTELGDSGVPFARAGNIKNGFAFDGADHLQASSARLAGDKLFRPLDIVFTSKGTVGRFAFVAPEMDVFAYSPQLCFWRSLDHDRLDPFVLHQWLLSRWFLDQVDRVKGQTDMAEYVSLRDQRRMLVPLPAAKEQKELSHELAAIQSRIWANTRETRTLTLLRDTLLPALLSGAMSTTEIAERGQ